FINNGTIRGNVALVIADGGEKYLNTIFNEEWLKERDLLSEQVWGQLDSWFALSSVEEGE
ncbi:cysteine synthase family protein, partial [Serratia marcescens]|nr:cysteine synthase family protein [Serratia marcescens]